MTGPESSQDTMELLLTARSPLVRRIQYNVSQDLIVIAEDKIHRCLVRNMDAVGAKFAWHTPAGLLSAIVLAFTTADFRDFIVPKATWQAFFMLAGVLTSVWLIKAIRQSWNAPSRERLVRVIIEELRSNTDALAPVSATKTSLP